MEELIGLLIEWSKKNNCEIIVNSQDTEKDIDFININLKTNKVYFGEINVDEPLTEVG